MADPDEREIAEMHKMQRVLKGGSGVIDKHLLNDCINEGWIDPLPGDKFQFTKEGLEALERADKSKDKG